MKEKIISIINCIHKVILYILKYYIWDFHIRQLTTIAIVFLIIIVVIGLTFIECINHTLCMITGFH